MTIRNPEVVYDQSLAQVLQLVCQRVLSKVRTTIPGVVDRYDAETLTAWVQPATDMMLADGSSMPRALALSVPVLWPTFGGYVIHAPLVAGDKVLLVYCERDISQFAASGRTGPLQSSRIMSEQDVVALPGFAPRGFAPVSSGLSLQALDGSTSVVIGDGTVTITGATRVRGSLIVNGTSVALDDHSHEDTGGGGQTGSEVSAAINTALAAHTSQSNAHHTPPTTATDQTARDAAVEARTAAQSAQSAAASKITSDQATALIAPYARSTPSGEIDEAQIPASIARDSEVPVFARYANEASLPATVPRGTIAWFPE